MPLAVNSIGAIDLLVVLLYLGATVFLGWLGYRRTRNAADYMLGGRTTHPFIMAMSYGATFISTSAIVGFGGVAGMFGMSLLWLCFLNIAVGIFVAFVVLGGPTRRMGQSLDAHTFPEFLGRRYQSKTIQMLAGGVIFVFMPLYASAVLSGGSKFTATEFGIDPRLALLIFAVLTAGYVMIGGLKAVMYTDTMQGIIMVVGMAVLLVYTYYNVGGIVQGHQYLTEMKDLAPGALVAHGHQGWTAMPAFGWGGGDPAHNVPSPYNLWWKIVTAIMLGVGIGVLAQPQLIVRFMTVKSKRELNRAVPIGAVFILIMVGVPYITGPLSNAYFAQHGQPLTGRIARMIDPAKGHALLQVMEEKNAGGPWTDVLDPKTNKPMNPAPVVLDEKVPVPGGATGADGQPVKLVAGRGIAIVYAKGDFEQIIPVYINAALPRWFGVLFFLTLLAAAMSTLSSQFHVLGTSAGRDLYEQATGRADQPGRAPSVLLIRGAIVLGLIAATTISYVVREEALIARFTAIFFGLCGATFLPAYVGGLFWKRMTRQGALTSMVVGFVISVFWLLLIKSSEAGPIGLVQKITGGKTSILWDRPNWPEVDPVLIALPLSILAAVAVSLCTQPPGKAHLDRCFGLKTRAGQTIHRELELAGTAGAKRSRP